MSATSEAFPGSRVSIFGKRTFSCDLMLQGHGGLMTFGMLCRNLREASHFEAGIWLLAVHTGKLLPCSTSRDALSHCQGRRGRYKAGGQLPALILQMPHTRRLCTVMHMVGIWVFGKQLVEE